MGSSRPPPYSPDLALSDLFRSIGNELDEQHFTSDEELKNGLQSYFDSKSRSFYEHDPPSAHKWTEVILNNGAYSNS
uniref:HTH_48 domain-containing protein n=1 Tax=Steinernema glaseri TaxID=37863 RepID=A0A1I8A6K7_9BILA